MDLQVRLAHQAKMVTKAIERAQTTVETKNAEIRKNVLKYDEVLNKQRKVIYTRDGRAVDNTVRSAEEAALLERVQGHASLAPPSVSHPSIAKYLNDDGTSLISEGKTAIAPRAVGGAKTGAQSPMLPKWQLEKELKENQQQVSRRPTADLPFVPPVSNGYAHPQCHRRLCRGRAIHQATP